MLNIIVEKANDFSHGRSKWLTKIPLGVWVWKSSQQCLFLLEIEQIFSLF